MSEESEKKEKEKKNNNEITIDSSSVFKAGDALVIKPESNTDLEIPTPTHTYTEYKASEEVQTIAFQQRRREYLKGIAQHGKFVVFLDTNSDEDYAKNPILDPKYNKQIILEFNSKISNKQYDIFNDLRAYIQDMERTSYGTLVDYKEMGVRPPEDFGTIRQQRRAKEKELYDIGLRIFFKMKTSETSLPSTIPEGMIDQMEMRSTRDLIDAMDIRLNLGIQKSASISTDISSTKKNMSSSIA